MGEMKKLFDVMDDILELFDRLMEVENSKLDAIAVNDVDKLDEHMRAEQACTMELRSLDARREQIQSELGFDGYTMRQIIEASSGEDKEKLREMYETLQVKTEELQVAVDCTKKFIELHIQSLDFLLAQMGGHKKEEETAYHQSGEKKNGEPDKPRFTSKKV